MKWTIAFFSTVILLAQQDAQTFKYDINGNRLVGPDVKQTKVGDTAVTDTLQLIDGRRVKTSSVEERIVRQDANGRVVERMERTFDRNGAPLATLKTVTEEQKQADGATIHSTVYRNDISGNLAPEQRSTTEIRRNGATTTTDTVVEKPTLNSAFEVVEKKNSTADDSPNARHENSVIYRRSVNGALAEAEREVVESTKQGPQTSQNASIYTLGLDGKLLLTKQTVTTSVKQPDGSQSTQVDIFTPNNPGIVGSADSKPQLREQQTFDRKVTADGTVDRVTVRTPDNSDPNRLGAPQRLSDSVCKGKCAVQ